MIVSNIFFILVILVFVDKIGGQYLNDDCVPNDGSAAGICKLAEDCEPSRRALMSSRPHNLRRCGFKNFSEIVCCPIAANRFGVTRKAETECKQILEHTLPPLGTLILGGEEANIGEFPYAVALGYEREEGILYNCAGSIISKNYVLTAAHCVDTSDNIKPTIVRTGVVNLGNHEWNDETDVGIAQYIVHPEFKRKARYHDLCLLRLSRSLEFNFNVNAVCLETSVEDPKQTLTVTGWGQMNETRAITSETLLKTNLTVVSIAECSKTFNEKTYRKLPMGLNDGMLCAGDPTAKHDACPGDSGGPILVPGAKGQYRLVGVTSFGKGCGSTVPGVYARVPRYLDWIESIVWPN